MKVQLNYGEDKALVLDHEPSLQLTEMRGPEGFSIDESLGLVRDALLQPVAGPPLPDHIVPGDKVVIAQAGNLPGDKQLSDAIYIAILESLEAGGVTSDDIQLVIAPPAIQFADQSLTNEVSDTINQPFHVTAFDPSDDSGTAYLLADESGEPLHLARSLVDADVVVTLGCFGYDASLHGRSPEGEIWPSFARQNRREALITSLSKSRRQALRQWRDEAEQIVAQLGVLASLHLVAGDNQTLAGVTFGFPASSVTQARLLAKPWRPSPQSRSALTIAGIADKSCGFAELTRALAAAARVTNHDGTVCIVCSMDEEPGPIFTRWRQGINLRMLLREALNSDDTDLHMDALQTSLFAQALGDRRLVLLSQLNQDLVEDLDIGCAETPDAVNRLIQQAESVCVIHEANRMCPRKI